MIGYVYLIHLDAPLSPKSASRHYIGYTKHVPSRMQQHARGRGARFMAVAKERGISWSIARIWPGDRGWERALKNRHDAPRLCPICRRMPPKDQLSFVADLEEDYL
jgi:hypothetical protein